MDLNLEKGGSVKVYEDGSIAFFTKVLSLMEEKSKSDLYKHVMLDYVKRNQEGIEDFIKKARD